MPLWSNVGKTLGKVAEGGTTAAFIIPLENRAASMANQARDYNQSKEQALGDLANQGMGKLHYNKLGTSTFDNRWRKSGIFGGIVDGLFDLASGGEWSRKVHKPTEVKV